MRFIDAAAVRGALTFPKLIAGLEAGHKRPQMEVQDAFLGDDEERYFVRHAVDKGRYMASKLITTFPRNLAIGKLPAVQAVCVVFDAKDGHPVAVIDGTEVTYWRTAADSGLGAKYLAPANPKVLLVVGAGGMSQRLVQAHRTVRPSIERVLIWNRTVSRAEEVVRELKAQGIDAAVATDLDAATAEANVISTCTRSREPVVKGRNIRPGTHLDLVGSYTPQMREVDDDAVRRSLIFVDLRHSAFDGAGEILLPIAAGVISKSDVLADMYDLAGGRVKGRRSPDDITFFKNAGGGHLDLMTCEVVLRELGEV